MSSNRQPHTLYNSRLSSIHVFKSSVGDSSGPAPQSAQYEAYQSPLCTLGACLRLAVAMVVHLFPGYPTPCEAWLQSGCSLFWQDSQSPTNEISMDPESTINPALYSRRQYPKKTKATKTHNLIQIRLRHLSRRRRGRARRGRRMHNGRIACHNRLRRHSHRRIRAHAATPWHRARGAAASWRGHDEYLSFVSDRSSSACSGGRYSQG